MRRINPYGRGFRYPILIDVANEAGIISSYFVVKKSFGHEKNKKAVIPLKAIPILGVDLLNQWLPLLIRGFIRLGFLLGELACRFRCDFDLGFGVFETVWGFFDLGFSIE